jgi:hypothetical protein
MATSFVTYFLFYFYMEDMKTPKRRTTRHRTAESTSPTPEMMEEAVCGHSSCGSSCRVHYAGPTSSIADHHAYHAAHAHNHVWAAAIISGLAVVLTGAIAYSSVEAKTTRDASMAQLTVDTQLTQVMQRLDQLEIKLNEVKATCGGTGTTGE